MPSRSAWVMRLSGLSPVVANAVQGNPLPEILYQAQATVTFVEAFNFCQSAPHNQALARCLEGLGAIGASGPTIRKYLTDLTSGRNTYGAICELLTYGWLFDNGIPFEAQIAVPGSAILNPEGSDLDGKLKAGLDVYFDVKAFGFQEMLVNRLAERLEQDLPGKWIAVEGSWDVSAETLGDLLGRDYSALLEELNNANSVCRRGIDFVKRDKSDVQVSTRVSDPYRLAEENASYVFRFAKQFSRQTPFVLFLATHPWLGGLNLNTDFGSFTSTYTRALARRTFIQFLQDASPVFDVTKAAASRLISAIGVLNISHLSDNYGKQVSPSLRLFVNPNATNPMPCLTVDQMQWECLGSVVVDDFRHDNY